MQRVFRPAARRASWERTIATLMMSAAVPWMTELTASRSPSLRVCQLRARISGIWRRRPNSVETYPCSSACLTASRMNCATAGKRSR